MNSVVLSVLYGVTSVGAALPGQVIEAENFARADPIGIPATQAYPEASGGQIVHLRSPLVGLATWLECDFRSPGGRFEVWVRSGGNDSRQAIFLSFDGGEEVLVTDERLSLTGEWTAEKRRAVEGTFTAQKVGVIALSKGRHRFRARHAGKEGFSNAFGLDCIYLVATSDPPTIKAGDRPTAPPVKAKRPFNPKDKAPRWLQEMEVYNAYRDTPEVLGMSPRFPLLSHAPRSEKPLRQAAARGFRTLCYISFHTWDALPRRGYKDVLQKQPPAELEFWGLVAHPEWMLMTEQGYTFSPFGPDYQGGRIREPCLNCPGVLEASVAAVKAIMEMGAGGIFVDNVHPSLNCYGDQFGRHKHRWPDRTNLEAYCTLLREVRKAVKSFGRDKIVMLNSGAPSARFADLGDVLMWESYICSGPDSERNLTWPAIKAAAEYWRAYTESGRRIAALCYLPSKGRTVQDDAFYTYACARLSGFQWADWYTMGDCGAKVLYTTRLGKPHGWMVDEGGVARRVFDHGWVVVNHTTQPQQVRLPVKWKQVTDLYRGQPLLASGGQIEVNVPADSGRVYLAQQR